MRRPTNAGSQVEATSFCLTHGQVRHIVGVEQWRTFEEICVGTCTHCTATHLRGSSGASTASDMISRLQCLPQMGSMHKQGGRTVRHCLLFIQVELSTISGHAGVIIALGLRSSS